MNTGPASTRTAGQEVVLKGHAREGNRTKHKLDALGSQQDNKSRSLSRSNDSNLIPALLNAKWHAGTGPAGILPSEISQCEPFKRGLKCHAKQQRSTGTETITYERAATISDVHKQSFTITYYNTVLKVASQTPAHTMAEAETPPMANSLMVGQKNPEHKPDCQLRNKKRQMHCNKDKIRNVSFSSK